VARSPVAGPVPVTFVISHALSGGSERYLELLLDHLEPAWVHGVVSLQDGPFVARLRASGFEVEVVETGPRLSMLPSAMRLRRLINHDPPAVVHANGVKAALVAALARPRAPVVWVKHDFSWDGPLARLVARRCARVVGVSAAVTATFRGRLRDRVRVVHNGIPAIDRDRSMGRDAVGTLIGAGGPVVILVGRLHPAKGQLELVEAAPRVLERRPDTRFLLLGGEDPYQLDYARRVRGRIAELGLTRSVLSRPHHPDAPGVMAGCEVAVMPSVPDERGMGREGFGLVGLEAMTVGTPVVGYEGGALPEVLGDCALLVPGGDRVQLAEGIAGLLDDPERRDRMADCGRRLARERFTIDSTVAGMRDCYVEVASASA
jgi:glycosyltransferase involved in cell wall biosynthesis